MGEVAPSSGIRLGVKIAHTWALEHRAAQLDIRGVSRGRTHRDLLGVIGGELDREVLVVADVFGQFVQPVLAVEVGAFALCTGGLGLAVKVTPITVVREDVDELARAELSGAVVDDVHRMGEIGARRHQGVNDRLGQLSHCSLRDDDGVILGGAPQRRVIAGHRLRLHIPRGIVCSVSINLRRSAVDQALVDGERLSTTGICDRRRASQAPFRQHVEALTGTCPHRGIDVEATAIALEVTMGDHAPVAVEPTALFLLSVNCFLHEEGLHEGVVAGICGQRPGLFDVTTCVKTTVLGIIRLGCVLNETRIRGQFGRNNIEALGDVHTVDNLLRGKVLLFALLQVIRVAFFTQAFLHGLGAQVGAAVVEAEGRDRTVFVFLASERLDRGISPAEVGIVDTRRRGGEVHAAAGHR